VWDQGGARRAAEVEEPDERHLHRMETIHGCIGKDPLVLQRNDNSAPECFWYRGVGRRIHLLKPVTGVDSSTRPLRRLGRPGKAHGSNSRTAAADPKSTWSYVEVDIVIPHASRVIINGQRVETRESRRCSLRKSNSRPIGKVGRRR
jgi:hypothetical protein